MNTSNTTSGCCLPVGDTGIERVAPIAVSATGRDTTQSIATQNIATQNIATQHKATQRKASQCKATQMIALTGGSFQMGAADGPYPQDGEGPVREVWLDPFELAAQAVTIEAFGQFVDATGYRTLAERVGNSFVFYAHCDPAQAYPAPTQATWWRQVPGACWHSPEGPWRRQTIQRDHPVTHIAYEDALAYCHWSGSRLPTEAEWEFAARGPLPGQPFPWGETLEQGGQHLANVWQGVFPEHNDCCLLYTSPSPRDLSTSRMPSSA